MGTGSSAGSPFNFTAEGGLITSASATDSNGIPEVVLVDGSGNPLEFLPSVAVPTAFGQNALVADTAELIIAANASRTKAIIANLHATIAVYVGFSNAVTVANGFPLAPGGITATAPATSRLEFGPEYVGEVWAIATGGTPNLAFIDI